MTFGYGEESGGRVDLDGAGEFDALLMSRLDFEIRVLDIPPVSEREIEGLISLRLRSIYPGSPRDTAFDYRILRPGGAATAAAGRGRTGRALVFISRRSTVQAYREAAGRRPLVLPCLLLGGTAPRKGPFRAWVWVGRWAEHLVYLDGQLLSSTVRRLGRGRSFDLAQEEEKLKPEEREGRLVVVAPGQNLSSVKKGEGVETLALEELSPPRRDTDGIFAARPRRQVLSPALRLAALALAVAAMGLVLFFKVVRSAEEHDARLRAVVLQEQKSNQQILAVQKEAEDLAAAVTRLRSGQPRDAYRLLSELSRLLGSEVRIRSLVLTDESFQVQAVGANPLKLMEVFASQPSFSGMKLSQVVPDPRTGKELFSISGVFHAG